MSIYIPNAGGAGGVNNYIWDTGTLAWVAQTASAVGGGDASSANQTTEIARLTSVLADTTSLVAKDFATQTTLALVKAKTDNLPALGQALAAASTPVVLTAAQITTLTPPTAVAITKIALTASAPTAATVGAASAQALASNANRKGLTLVNTSVNTISIGIGSAAVLNSGITLNASGGAFVMDAFTLATGAINAIASAGSSNLAIQEFT